MFRFRKKYFSGFGNVAFITAGSLLVLAALLGFIFVNFGDDFLSSEVGLETESSDLITGPAKTSSSPPLLAKVLPPPSNAAGKFDLSPVKKPAVSSKQNEVNFDIAKPTASPEDNFAPVGENFFANQTVGGSEETEPGPLIKLVVSEILFGAKDSAKEEFIELYNPNNFAVELSRWELRKKTENGNDSVLVSSQKFSGAIQPKSYFLISHPDFSEKFGADLAWSSKSYSISENNAIYLLDDFGRQIDLVGCGPAFDYESAACIVPETGVSISRPDNADTDNNQKDFSFSKPSPGQNFVAYVPQLTPSPLAPQPNPPALSSLSPSPEISSSPSPTESSLGPEPSFLPSPLPSPAGESGEPPSPSLEVLFPQITEVQIGLEGSVNADFIKIYNPNSAVLDLKDYKLIKKTTSGTEYTIKSWRAEDENNRIVSGLSDFYWVNSGYQEKINELTDLGRKFFPTTATISATNQIILKHLDDQVSVW